MMGITVEEDDFEDVGKYILAHNEATNALVEENMD